MTHKPPAPTCGAHKYYFLTCEDYDRLAARADGRCEICSIPAENTPHRQLHIDHDPSVGRGAVRGLLCSRCNTRLGRGLVPAEVAEAWMARPLFQFVQREEWSLRLRLARRAG